MEGKQKYFKVKEGNTMINQYFNPSAMGYNNSQNNNLTRHIDGNNNIIWVDDEVGAKAYPLYGSNCAVLMMDSNMDNIVYLKTTDMQGRSNTQKYQLTPIMPEEPKQLDLTEYVRKDELEKLILSMLPDKEGAKDESVIPTTQPIIKKSVPAK